MKKIFACLLALSVLVSLSTSALAADFSQDAEVELCNLTEEIIATVSELYGEEITSNDIDFTNAFKVYVDTNVFDLPTNDASEIEDALESGNYIYLLPISVDKGTIVVNIQKGLPLSDNAKAVLTEEEQQEVLNNVGKWIASSITLYDLGNNSYDYAYVLSRKVNKIPDGTLLVGSLPIFEDVVALVPNSEGDIEKIVPVTNTSYSLGQMSNSRNSSEVYDYSTVKEYAKELPAENTNLAGGIVNENVATSQSGVFFSIALLVVCGGVAMLLIKNKKSKSGGKA